MAARRPLPPDQRGLVSADRGQRVSRRQPGRRRRRGFLRRRWRWRSRSLRRQRRERVLGNGAGVARSPLPERRQWQLRAGAWRAAGCLRERKLRCPRGLRRRRRCRSLRGQPGNGTTVRRHSTQPPAPERRSGELSGCIGCARPDRHDIRCRMGGPGRRPTSRVDRGRRMDAGSRLPEARRRRDRLRGTHRVLRLRRD